jgi:hypothetical protein
VRVCLAMEHFFKLKVKEVTYMNNRNFSSVGVTELTFIIWELGILICTLWACWLDFNTGRI